MEIVKIFPVHIREALANDTWKAGLEEIRVRVGSPLEFIYGGESRYLPEHARNEAGKKMLGTTSILLRGIPFIYQGQEIGMTNCIRNDISEYDDISTKDQ